MQFTNQATLLYNGITKSSNIVTGEITQIITAWKDATVNTYQNGDILTYVISLQNSGSSDITGLNITDNLGAYTIGDNTYVPLTYTNDPVLYYINGVFQLPPVITAGPPLVFNNITVLAKTSTILIYRVSLNEYTPYGTGESITNTVTISGNELSTDVTVEETIDNNDNPILSIMKSINPITIIENEQVTYTFTIQNTGISAATIDSDIIINDLFNPVLSNISVALNGAFWPVSGNYTYNTTTGEFETIAGQITVPAATYTQNQTTGVWTMIPGITILEVTGTI